MSDAINLTLSANQTRILLAILHDHASSLERKATTGNPSARTDLLQRELNTVSEIQKKLKAARSALFSAA